MAIVFRPQRSDLDKAMAGAAVFDTEEELLAHVKKLCLTTYPDAKFKSLHPHFKWGFEFNPSGVLYWFRLGRGFATPLIPVAANGG